MVVSTHLKNMLVKMGSSSPKFGVKKKYLKPQPVLTDGGWTNLGVKITKIIWHYYWEGEIDPTYTLHQSLVLVVELVVEPTNPSKKYYIVIYSQIGSFPPIFPGEQNKHLWSFTT